MKTSQIRNHAGNNRRRVRVMEGVRLYGITGGRLCVAPVTEKSGAKIRLAFPDGEAHPFLRKGCRIIDRMSYMDAYEFNHIQCTETKMY